MYYSIIEVLEIDVDISKKSSLSKATESMYVGHKRHSQNNIL